MTSKASRAGWKEPTVRINMKNSIYQYLFQFFFPCIRRMKENEVGKVGQTKWAVQKHMAASFKFCPLLYLPKLRNQSTARYSHSH